MSTARMVRFLAAVGTPATGSEPPSPLVEHLTAFSRRGDQFGLWTGSRDENIAIGIRG